MDKKQRRKMFTSVLPGEQVEVALAEEGSIQEYYVEMTHQAKTKGNIYKGYIHNIDHGLQAAFINYGAERNGFLQIDEVHPEYYQGAWKLKKGSRYPLIQNVLKPGQEILVQVVKEPTGKKGAFLSTFLSLPGRYFVYSIGKEQSGVSRKIEDDKERARLKDIIEELATDEGVGLIVRTAGIGRNKTDLIKDYKYLNRMWADIKKQVQSAKAPALIYKELELATRAVRDYLTSDVSEIWVDDDGTAEIIRAFMRKAFPRTQAPVRVHDDPTKTLWERFNLDRQIEEIYSRGVSMPSGGGLVFDMAEALTAVDVNSGRIGGEKSFHQMVLKTNLEAAEEVARQLKLRDIGGQIVIDFIEMKSAKDYREVEKTMRQALKSDRARTSVLRISEFGLMQIVRQRMGSSALAVTTEPCPCCKGTGNRRNMEWQALQALKAIFRGLRGKNAPSPFVFPCQQELALHLLNHKNEKLREMEKRFDTKILIDVEAAPGT